ncbi:MAG: family 43 glycosylhydrolase [Exilibacterium sp.]
MRLFVLFVFNTLLFALLSACSAPEMLPGREPQSSNPILPGYYADPSLVIYEGTAYLYATLDPWGGETLGLWESDDFQHWSFRELNWPTKAACTSPTSKSAGVWAPSVVRGGDGRFYMYVSVGNEVWAGVADHPAGPWKNLLGDQPLIPENFKPGFHMIDAEAFIDEDGQAWLYWGSGWNWVNGKCWAVKLSDDMKTFDGTVHDVTPPNYFEAPFMYKHGGRYHLMYSSGRTPLDTYQVHSAVGDSPLGPFMEEPNSPILVTDIDKNVVSPGHHAVFVENGQPWILYHRHSIPYSPDVINRQICADPLAFDGNGHFLPVTPTHRGPVFTQRKASRQALPALASASSQSGGLNGPENVLDDNYATKWQAFGDEKESWIQLDFGKLKSFSVNEVRLEYAWKTYRLKLESSSDGRHWEVLVDQSKTPVKGSPLRFQQEGAGRYLRLVFPGGEGEPVPALFEWQVY